MAEDIAKLGIDVDTSAVIKAKKDLTDLGTEAGKATPKVVDLGNAVDETTKKVGRARDANGRFIKAVKETGDEAAKAKPKVDDLGKAIDEAGQEAEKAKPKIDGAGKAAEEAGNKGKKGGDGLRDTGKGAKEAAAGAKEATTATAQMERNLATLASTAKLVKAGIAGMFGAAIVHDLTNTQQKIDSFVQTMTFVTGSTEEAKNEFQTFMKTADQLGVSIEQVMGPYAGFAAAAKSAGLTLDQTRQVFSGFSAGMMATGRSAEDTQRALVAVQQMLSKGKVSAEDFTQQLAEAFPLAMSYAAKAMGFGADETGKFIQAMQDGNINAKALLVTMAQDLNRDFTNAGDKAETTGQQMSQLDNAIFKLKEQFLALGGGHAITDVIEALTKLVGQLEGVAGAAGPVAQGLGDGIAGALGILTTALDTFLPKGRELRDLISELLPAVAAFIGVSRVAGPLAGAVVGVGTYVLGQDLNISPQEAQQQLATVQGNIAFARQQGRKDTDVELAGLLMRERKLQALIDKMATEDITAATGADKITAPPLPPELGGGKSNLGPLVDPSLGGSSKRTIADEIRDAAQAAEVLKQRLAALPDLKPKVTAYTAAERKEAELADQQARIKKLDKYRDDPRYKEAEAALAEQDRLEREIKERKKAIQERESADKTAATKAETEAKTALKNQQEVAAAADKAQRAMDNLRRRQGLQQGIFVGKYDLEQLAKANTLLEQSLAREEKIEAFKKKPGVTPEELDLYRQRLEAEDDLKNAMAERTKEINKQVEAQERLNEEDRRAREGGARERRAQDEAVLEKQKQKVQELRDAFVNFGEVAGDAMLDVAHGARSLDDALKHTLNTWIDMAARMAMQYALQAAAGALFPMPPGQPTQELPTTIGGAGGTARPYARGGVFEGGEEIRFAAGGIVTAPTRFPLLGGRRGLMGESGAEGVVPLKRLPDGSLGVRADGTGNNVAISTTVNLNGNAEPEDAERIGKEVEKRVARAVDERMLKHARNGSVAA